MKNLTHLRVFIPYEGSNGPQKAMVDKINELVDRINELSKIVEQQTKIKKNMNQLTNNFTTIEEGIADLKKAVALRDQMGGPMYYNMLNEDCCEIARKLKTMGADKAELSQILGEGTHVV